MHRGDEDLEVRVLGPGTVGEKGGGLVRGTVSSERVEKSRDEFTVEELLLNGLGGRVHDRQQKTKTK